MSNEILDHNNQTPIIEVNSKILASIIILFGIIQSLIQIEGIYSLYLPPKVLVPFTSTLNNFLPFLFAGLLSTFLGIKSFLG